MLVLLTIYYLSGAGLTHAIPIQVLSIAERSSSSCDDLDHCRTVWDVIWSCLVTVFLSTWVATHPNVPYPINNRRGDFLERWLWGPLCMFISHRLPLFVWALISPEYILAWAIRQHFTACRIAKQNRGWTKTHGFFVVMGGFHLFRRPDGPCDSLNPHDDDMPHHPLSIKDLVDDGGFKFDLIVPTEEEIQDKSKSDWLSKALVIIQTAWFVIQCIARGIEQLPVTKLEVVSLAYAALNFWIYLFWWHKPLNVERPIRVVEKYTAGREVGGLGGNANGGDTTRDRAGPKRKQLLEDRKYGSVLRFFVGIQDYDVVLSDEDKVPTFWSGDPTRDEILISDVVIAIIGIAFGGIHCIAWSFTLPSHIESILWRTSCIAIMIIPAYALAFGGFVWIYEAAEDNSVTKKGMKGIIIASSVLLLPLALLYIAARIVTVVLAFMSLRSLPPAAYKTVHWMNFIPHI